MSGVFIIVYWLTVTMWDHWEHMLMNPRGVEMFSGTCSSKILQGSDLHHVCDINSSES